MSQRIPDDAFDFYLGLGPARSYRAVADRYGVSKRAVVKHAQRERWTERLRGIQEKARSESEKNLADEMVEMHDRHKKMLKAMAVRALSGLKEFPLRSGMEAIRAAELVIKMERIVHGEPSEPGVESIAEITKREIAMFLIRDDEPEGWEEPAPAEGEFDPAPLAPPPHAEVERPQAPGELTLRDIVHDPDAE